MLNQSYQAIAVTLIKLSAFSKKGIDLRQAGFRLAASPDR